MGQQTLMHWPQVPGRTPNPVRQRRSIKIDALARINLRLPIERQMIGIFGDQDLRDRSLRRDAALDQSRQCRSLRHNLLASPAGVFGAAGDQHTELRGNNVQPLTHVLTDPMQLTMAAGAFLANQINDLLKARQMSWQRSPVPAACLGASSTFLWRAIVHHGRIDGFRLLKIFKGQQQLVLGQRLSTTAEPAPTAWTPRLDLLYFDNRRNKERGLSLGRNTCCAASQIAVAH